MSNIEVHIPGYELESLIGRGGMAEVYLARQISLGRKVALKVLLQSLSPDPSFAMRFEREAKTAAALQHPNIIKIFDTGLYEGRYYIAMEYLGSMTLKNLIIEGMSPNLAVKYLAKIASALDYAHAKGVIHRDIKPANVLLYPDNEPVLSDFGISRLVDSNSNLTATGMMIGSPRYTSPEQARGSIVDSRSDLYALGVVFFEMLTGAPPYDVEDPFALMYMHVHDPIPQLPPALHSYQPVIDTLMAKQPDQRPARAGEILPLLGFELDRTIQFSEVNETIFVPSEFSNTSPTNPTFGNPPISATSASTDSHETPFFRTGSQQIPTTGSMPAGGNVPPDQVPPAQPPNRDGHGYGGYALLAMIIISVVGLYWFLAPADWPRTLAIFTDSPPTPGAIEEIAIKLQNKVDAGEFDAARELLKQGLALDALDQRLLAFADRIRAGIKQQAAPKTAQTEPKTADKIINPADGALATAKDKISSGEFDAALTSIDQAKKLGAEPTIVTDVEKQLALAQESAKRQRQLENEIALTEKAEQKQRKYSATLAQSRAALKANRFYEAEQSAKKALALEPDATEVEQLLFDIERARITAEHKNRVTELQNTIDQALNKEDMDEARDTLDLLKQENPENSVIVHYDSLIADKETKIKTRDLFDKHFQLAKSLHEQGRLMEGLSALEPALSVDPERVEAQTLLQIIQFERDQEIADLKQEILNALVTHDLAGAKHSLDRLKKLGGSVIEIEAHITQLEQRQADNLLPLTVHATPADAKIRILNIGPAYRPGMKLGPGSYKIEVSKTGYEAHVSMFELKQGQEVYQVELEIAPLKIPSSRQSDKRTTPKDPADEQATSTSPLFKEPQMVKIPAGWFQMGCVYDNGCKHNEKPVHDVNVFPFEIGKYEVTFDEWDSCVDDGGCGQRLRDKGWGRGKRPVINVSWDDAQEYILWLNQKTGKQYRLPTEAEWEYAARAGTSTPYSFSGKISTDKANYDGNYIFGGGPVGVFRQETLPVGSFPANPWGLHDMHGNVWEWVQDCLHENYEGAPSIASAWTIHGDCSKRGMRGGSWNSHPGNLRSSNRGWFIPGRRYFIDGFRLAR